MRIRPENSGSVTKSDLVAEHAIDLSFLPQASENPLIVSSADGSGIAELLIDIERRINQLFSTRHAPFLLNARQRSVLESLHSKVMAIEELTVHSIEYELVAYHVHEAIAHVSELTGKNINEQMLDTVFRSFCIGK